MALKYISPWNLTPRQADVMDAMVEHGCHKLAGRALGIDEDTVMQHIWMANKKMGFHSGHLVKYIQWDRWRRSGNVDPKPEPKCCVCGTTQGRLRADGIYGHRCSSPNCMVY